MIVAALVARAAQIWGVSREEILSAQVSPRVFMPRAAVAHVAVRTCGLTYPRTGHGLGDRDHTTILNAVRRAAVYAQQDIDFRAKLAELAAFGCSLLPEAGAAAGAAAPLDALLPAVTALLQLAVTDHEAFRALILRAAAGELTPEEKRP